MILNTKQKSLLSTSIENTFQKLVQKDKNLKNAYLLVHSEKLGVHINIAEGYREDQQPANPQQPNYMASVGKLFTSILVGVLVENGYLSFDDSISKHLDRQLLNKLHVYKGKDYTEDIKIKHLLNQTSGLYDVFWPLLEKLLDDPNFYMSPREAIIWGKNHLKPDFPPGDGFKYTDTNYYLIGLIVENVTGMPFHKVIEKYIYRPLGMFHSSMLHYSVPLEKCFDPIADFYVRGTRMNDLKGYASLDYAGGGVVATNDDLLKFMKALVAYQIVTKDTLEKILKDQAKFGFGIGYGYGVMRFKTIPLLQPKILNVWGHAGATGAFMFYHPEMDAYLIGNFNDFSYERKGVTYMLKMVYQMSKYNRK